MAIKKVLIAVFSFLVAWLAISLILGVAFTFIGNPMYNISPRSGQQLTGLLILVLTILLGGAIYRDIVRRFLVRGGVGGRPTATDAPETK